MGVDPNSNQRTALELYHCLRGPNKDNVAPRMGIHQDHSWPTDARLMEIMAAVFHYIGIVLICLCLSVVVIKVIWNFGLPYAMMREKRHGWSIFLLIEAVPLLAATLISFVTQQQGAFAPGGIAVWGLAAIVASYIHLVFVALLHGIVKRHSGYKTNDRSFPKQDGPEQAPRSGQ